jgi:hypothetical protein
MNAYIYPTSPAEEVDPLGLASCTYEIAKHHLECVSNDGKNTRTISDKSVFSGQNHYQKQCQNNPQCVDYEGFGPIPPGAYNMNHDTREGNELYWRLEPNPKKSWWQCNTADGSAGRCGFMLHPGNVSEGCITVDGNDETAMRQYKNLHELLLQENGTNKLKVLP